jgi:hypothetical protein
MVRGDARRRSTSRRKPNLEALEDRVVPAFSITNLINGVLIVGDDGNNTITLSRVAADPSKLLVQEGAQQTETSITSSDFNVYLYGRGGDDTLQVDETNGSFTSYTVGTTPVPAMLVSLFGEGGNDTLRGGSGDDLLDGGDGLNNLDGGAGSDTGVQVADANMTLTNSALVVGGTSLAWTSVESARLYGGSSNNKLDASAFTLGPVLLDGGDGDDTLTGGAGDDTLDGGPGTNTLVDSGDITFTLTDSRLDGHGTDTLSRIQRARLVGGDGDNELNAVRFSGPVTLIGGAGNDLLIGGAGDDSLDGGLGDDTLRGGPGVDAVVATGADDDRVQFVDAYGNLDPAQGDSGFVEIRGEFLDTWLANGGEGGFFHAPVDNVRAGPAAPGGTVNVTSQRFEGGLIYKAPSTGLLTVPYDLPAAAQPLFSDNPAAYAAVRASLLRDFFYNGFIAERIESENGNRYITFADQTVRLGNALVEFSQEATILQHYGFDPSPSENIVKILLNAFDQLDRDAETALYPGPERPGLFLRDYVGVEGAERQGVPASLIIKKSDFLSGRAGQAGKTHQYVDPVMSQDQITFMMNGWWAVTHYSTDPQNVTHAIDQARRVISAVASR